MIGYPLDKLRKEVAYIAYFFHWDPDSILNLDHQSRKQWVNEIAAINLRMNGEE